MIANKQTTLWQRAKTAGRILFNSGYNAAKNTRARGRRKDTQSKAEYYALDASDRQRVIATLLDFATIPWCVQFSACVKLTWWGQASCPRPKVEMKNWTGAWKNFGLHGVDTLKSHAP